MSFLYIISLLTHKKKLLTYSMRKEEDSAKTRPVSPLFPKGAKRTSLLTSFRGSVSIEAALIVPVFFLAACCLCYLLEVMAIQGSVRAGLHDAGRELAKEAYVAPAAIPSRIEKCIIENIGAERLGRSIIRDGGAGIDCSRTVVSPGTGIIQMRAEYEIVLPVTMFGRLSLSLSDGFRIKAWTGYEKEGLFLEKEDVVYISETGIVYHKDYHCSYLELSIQMADKNAIGSMRNEYGEKYRACTLCGRNTGTQIYITSQGNRYHSSLSCSGLKRSVYAVPVSEVMGKGACSRCGR